MKVEEPALKYEFQMSPEEFIQWERKADTKHEYTGKKIISMAGASFAHNAILASLMGHIYPVLKGRPCNIYPSDLRIYIRQEKSYFYPDATIICGDPEFSDAEKDTVKNPSVIFEVLSPSTENYDLGKKLFLYMQIESLQQYVTISATDLQVRSGVRQPDNAWKFEELTAPEDKLLIKPTDLELPLKDLYEDIAFSASHH